jgi:hypothetical protein
MLRATAAFLPTSDGEEIAGNRHRLVESIQLVLGLGFRGFANGQTTGHDRKRGSDVEIKGALDIWSILTREDRPGMDCLALRD